MHSIIDRRFFFKIAASGVTGYFMPPLKVFGESSPYSSSATLMSSARNVVFVLLTGAPSQVDTLDLKVGSWTPANFNPTTTNGIDFPAGLLPTLADQFGRGR